MQYRSREATATRMVLGWLWNGSTWFFAMYLSCRKVRRIGNAKPRMVKDAIFKSAVEKDREEDELKKKVRFRLDVENEEAGISNPCQAKRFNNGSDQFSPGH
nr:hypothetical protein Itr_chr13CG12100 [Ipomoea trifida]